MAQKSSSGTAESRPSAADTRAPRASWIQTELLLTFPTPVVRTITLIPLKAEETGGRFRVWVDLGDGASPRLVWDRKVSQLSSAGLHLHMSLETFPGSFSLLLSEDRMTPTHGDLQVGLACGVYCRRHSDVGAAGWASGQLWGATQRKLTHRLRAASRNSRC